MRVPNALALLGDLLDVGYEPEAGAEPLLLKLRDYVVLAATDRKTIFLLPKGRRETEPVLPERAAQLREDWVWTGRDADTSSVTRARWSATTKRLGAAVSIGYRSDKDGTRKSYQHDYRSRPTLSQSGNVYRISGGKQQIKRAGIDG